MDAGSSAHFRTPHRDPSFDIYSFFHHREAPRDLLSHTPRSFSVFAHLVPMVVMYDVPVRCSNQGCRKVSCVAASVRDMLDPRSPANAQTRCEPSTRSLHFAPLPVMSPDRLWDFKVQARRQKGHDHSTISTENHSPSKPLPF